MQWYFIPQPNYLVEQGITQRDQFNNDEVNLSDTLVRESIQNSLDAATGKVHVSFKHIQDGLKPDFFQDIFKDQIDHAQACGIEFSKRRFQNPTALIIEDFGTTGLTGSFDSKDPGDFSDFWRRHGKSHKSGVHRGRWGLGKLVYSLSSDLRAFFGFTVRADKKRLLMGQTVLDLHSYKGKEYPAHAFYSEFNEDKNIQVPVTRPEIIDHFITTMNLKRRYEPGLSIIIPFPNQNLTTESMISIAIQNYFYPILTEQLTLSFNDIEVNSKNLRQLAHKYATKMHDIDKLFDFIQETRVLTREKKLYVLQPAWIDDERIDEKDFSGKDLEEIRNLFNEEKVVGIQLPVEIHSKSKGKQQTSFNVFLQRPETLNKGQDLYVRGGLTLPNEAKFFERKALGAMIADDEAISAFLGDAENAAHTKWIQSADKLKNHYRKNPGRVVKAIRNSVVNFYDMLVQTEKEEDEKALVKFFYTKLPEESPTKNSEQGESPSSPQDLPPSRPAPLRINPIDGGFAIEKNPGITDQDFPIECRLALAYDTKKGDPIKNHNPLDFDLRESEPLTIKGSRDTVKVTFINSNTLNLKISSSKFSFKIIGFDPNRDLVVKLDTRETGEGK